MKINEVRGLSVEAAWRCDTAGTAAKLKRAQKLLNKECQAHSNTRSSGAWAAIHVLRARAYLRVQDMSKEEDKR